MVSLAVYALKEVIAPVAYNFLAQTATIKTQLEQVLARSAQLDISATTQLGHSIQWNAHNPTTVLQPLKAL
jgi:hypothetical protein